MSTINYSEARQNLADLITKVILDRTPVTITRRGHENVVLISEREFTSILETAHLLKSPANARRLFESLESARRGEGEMVTPQELASRLGLDVEFPTTSEARPKTAGKRGHTKPKP